MQSWARILVCVTSVALGVGRAFAEEGAIDVTKAHVVLADDATPREATAARVLVEEVEKRTGVRWPIVKGQPGVTLAGPTIRIGAVRSLPSFSDSNAGIPRMPPEKKEGFGITTAESGVVHVIGRDERGVLFGVGYLLRKMEMRPGSILVPRGSDIETAPATPLRGHQLGYRPKTNSYDAWDLPVWEQYLRDLTVFGTNAIELVPPKTDDDATSPHFPRPQIEMMAGMSKLADELGMDVWVWYTAIDGDYSDPKVVEKSLQEWGDVLGKLPRCDAIFIPTGDPGNTRPSILMPFLEKQAAQLRKIHPNATVWISVQGLIQPWWDEMWEILDRQPEWLAGVVFGPQTRVSLPELRKRLPERYPIRRYPDITHCIWCQYPVVDWDLSFALTEGREPINPRPVAQSIIYRAFDREALGFLTYSEGCNDDVNKMVWSALGWNRDTPVEEIMEDYGRSFIGPDQSSTFAQGILGLEENWRGPVEKNESIPKTLALFQGLEKSASDKLKKNWRFQQALYRAYYDAFVQARHVNEQELEREALSVLANADEPKQALDRAESILTRATREPVRPDLRERVIALADDLYHSIGMQLSVPKYKAIAQWRGANLDSIDVPLNDSEWLRKRFAAIRKLKSEKEQLAAIQKIVGWSDPGPGGFYDDLGDPAHQPRAVRHPDYVHDPASLASPYINFEPAPGFRRSWSTYLDGLFNVPVVVKYEGLDPNAKYKVRVTYATERRGVLIRLTTDDGQEIHPLMDRPLPVEPIEFPIPPESTSDGALTLLWHGDPERGGNGRGPQVAEVWLLKMDDAR